MTSFITDDFVKLFGKLPKEIQDQARNCYKKWLNNPFHPSLQFKEVNASESIWSVRINIGWRVMGLRENENIYWFWIGNQDDYDKLIRHFR